MTDTPADDSTDEVLDEIRRLREEIDVEDLEPTTPKEAIDLWFEGLGDRSDSTLQSYDYRVSPFLAFLEENGIDNLNDVKTRHVKEFEGRLVDEGHKKQSRNNKLGTIQQFLKYCWEIDAVPREVVDAVDVPDLEKSDRVNTEKLIAERSQRILDHLDRYQYASRDHVILLLLWRSTIRIGALRTLDLHDLYLEEETDLTRVRQHLRDEGFDDRVIDEILEDVELPFIIPRHRPEQETPLKNGYAGERLINLAEWVGEVIQDYVDVNRPDLEDEHGRRPLLCSKKGTGRLSTTAIRNAVYILTQPCEIGDECPYDEDPEVCEAREHGHGSKCPSSRSPHKIRTGAITHHRDRGWPVDDLAAKANAGEELIRGVYDQPEQFIRGAARRQHLGKLE